MTAEEMLYSRTPLVGPGLRQRALKHLFQWLREGRQHAVPILTKALDDHFDVKVRQQIRRELSEVRNPWLILHLTEAWRTSRSPALRQMALQSGWLPERESPARAFAALEQGRAQVLSQDGVTTAEALLQLSDDPDGGLAERAREAIGFMQRPEIVNALWSVWSSQRQDWLARRLGAAASAPSWLRVLSLLTRNESFTPDAYSAELLQAARDHDPELAQRARDMLARLTDATAVWQSWRLNRGEGWLAELVRRLPPPAEPPELAALARLLLGLPLEASLVPALLEATTDPELGQRALQTLAELPSQEGREALCRLALKDDRARSIALSSGFAPEGAHERALFFFLTYQWQAYEELDDDRSLLRIAYELADQELRLLINQRARQAGRVEWASLVSSALRPEELSREDWEAVCRLLEQAGRLEDMARLARAAPPFWSLWLLRRIPTGRAPGLEELLELARACPESSEPDSLDALRRVREYPGQSGSVTSLIEWGEGLVAGYQDGSLLVLPERRLSGHAQAVTSLAVDPVSGTLLSGSRDRTVCLRTADGNRWLEAQRGPVTSVALSRCASRAAVAGLDRRVRILDLRKEREHTLTRLSINALCFGPDGLYFGGEDGWVRHEHGDEREAGAAVLSLAVSRGGRLLAAGCQDARIRLWSPHLDVLEGHRSWVTCLRFSECGRLLISGDLDGTVLIWRTSDGQKVREMKATPLGLTSLIVDRTGRRIAVGGDDGAVAMFEGSLLGAPLLEELRRADIEWLQERLGAPSAVEEEPWLRFLLALHLCRFGHDIELDTSPIAVGSFHIQLEG